MNSADAVAVGSSLHESSQWPRIYNLTANASAGGWWADPVAALLMVPWLIREGVEVLRGEACCD